MSNYVATKDPCPGCPGGCSKNLCEGCTQYKCKTRMHNKTGLCKWCAYLDCSKCKRRVMIINTKSGQCWDCEPPFPSNGTVKVKAPKRKVKAGSKTEKKETKKTREKAKAKDEDKETKDEWRADVGEWTNDAGVELQEFDWEERTPAQLLEDIDRVQGKLDDIREYLERQQKGTKRGRGKRGGPADKTPGKKAKTRV